VSLVSPYQITLSKVYFDLVCHLVINILTTQTRNYANDAKPERRISNTPVLKLDKCITAHEFVLLTGYLSRWLVE